MLQEPESPVHSAKGHSHHALQPDATVHPSSNGTAKPPAEGHGGEANGRSEQLASSTKRTNQSVGSSTCGTPTAYDLTRPPSYHDIVRAMKESYVRQASQGAGATPAPQDQQAVPGAQRAEDSDRL